MSALSLSVKDYVDGVSARDPMILARAVTLIESSLEAHRTIAQQVLDALLPLSGKALRLGITGVPGAGKSTFIESFGSMLCHKGLRVAVLAIDPTSTLSGGSILGDKTRMAQLSTEPNAFIRPSPSGGTLGGVARKTRESMLLCEAAGYDVIIVETVGVGQSESTVRTLVDFFLLIMITGAGDELQGIKKGIIELADAIVINKADGENEAHAERSKCEFNQLLSFLSGATSGWKTRAHTCSSLSGKGIEELWQLITEFEETTKKSSVFQQRRLEQQQCWMENLVHEGIFQHFLALPEVQASYTQAKAELAAGKISAVRAAERVLQQIKLR